MNITLFDTPEQRLGLAPLTLTRPVCDLRIGIFTIREKWEKLWNSSTNVLTEGYLTIHESHPGDVLINGGLCPSVSVQRAIDGLEKDQVLVKDGVAIAAKPSQQVSYPFNWQLLEQVEFNDECHLIQRSHHLFHWNGAEMEVDFELVSTGRESATLSSTNTIIGDRIFVEEGAQAEASVINATTGPVYLGKDSLIMEGALVRGGLAMCQGSVLKLGAKIYGPTTVGPHSKVGGEVNNSVILGYSNKGHDGFMGNSVIGEWCNLGADTNTSNLKNNYAEVKLYHYKTGRFEPTGLQFCGLIMGDHAKCGINTMFNTGTVVGVGANIFGSGFPRNFIPSFAWGGSQGFTTYRLDKMLEVAKVVMARRKIDLTEDQKAIFGYLYEDLADKRFWELKKDLNI